MNPRHGFTLVEVLVALAVGGMTLSAAAALIGALDGRVGAVAAARARVDRHANAERLLRSLWRNLSFAIDSAQPAASTVLGDTTTLRIGSWCETPDGWLERCAARLAVQERADGGSLRLVLDGSTTQTFDLFPGSAHIAFRYLTDARYGGTWDATWTARLTPAAVAVIVDRDTLLLPIGVDD